MPRCFWGSLEPVASQNHSLTARAKGQPLNDYMQGLRKELMGIARRPEDQIDLAQAALVIARLEYPDLDELRYLLELEGFAMRVRSAVAGLSSAHALAGAMGRILFQEEGFKGNSDDYYDPDNSFLNRVVDRRAGIPISLSLVYMEVGRRAGLDVRGVGLPGHFIAALHGADGRILVDPFHDGSVLSEEECRRRVTVHFGGSKVFSTRFLEPVRPGQMLARLLRNLKGIYKHMGDGMKAFQMLEWILSLDPAAADEYKERAMLYEKLGAYDRAVKDLRKYLQLSPWADDTDKIEARIRYFENETSTYH